MLNSSIVEKLRNCVDLASPNECCGLIFGSIEEISLNNDYSYHYNGKRARCIPSDEKTPISFLMKNMELLNQIIIEELQFEPNKSQLLSIFHSHPSGNNPSSVDINNMIYLDHFGEERKKYMSRAFKNLIWLIIDAKNYDINGFIYFEKKIQEIDVIIS